MMYIFIGICCSDIKWPQTNSQIYRIVVLLVTEEEKMLNANCVCSVCVRVRGVCLSGGWGKGGGEMA